MMSTPSDEESLILQKALEIDPATLDNAVLRRLITEIQQEDSAWHESTEHDAGNPLLGIHGYNRTYNRHNRSMNHPGSTYNRTHNRHNRGQ